MNWKMASDASAGTANGRRMRVKMRQVPRAVDARGFEQVRGERAEEVAQEVDGEGQAEGRVRQPDREIVPVCRPA